MRDFRLGRGGSGPSAAPDCGPPSAVLRFGAHRRARKKTCAARAALLGACAKPARGDCVSYWFKNDSRMPQMRLKVVSFGIVAIITLLLSGFWKLQVVDSDHYTQLAERNSIRTIPIIAPRGNMLDREGRVLVDGYPSFSVLLLRDDAALLERTLPLVADGLNISLEDLRQQVEAARPLPKFQAIVVKPEANKADIAFIESHRADLPSLEMFLVHPRRYLPCGFMAHHAAYVGQSTHHHVHNTTSRFWHGH